MEIRNSLRRENCSQYVFVLSIIVISQSFILISISLKNPIPDNSYLFPDNSKLFIIFLQI